MSDFDVFDDSDHLPADHLINELESIKDILHRLDDDTTALPTELPTDIPLLDDMVIGGLDANARLLNLNRIFEEDSEETSAAVHVAPIAQTTVIAPRVDISFPRFQLDTMLTDDAPEPAAPINPAAASIQSAASPTLSSPPPQKITSAVPRIRPDYSRDVLIQELVDEFVPQIEAALRERLSQLDDAALQQWKDGD